MLKMGLVMLSLPFAKGEAPPPDTWWDGLLAMLIGTLAVLLFSAAVVGIRHLFGLDDSPWFERRPWTSRGP